MPSNHHLHPYHCLGISKSGVHLYQLASLIWCCVKTHLCCWQVTSRKDQQQYWHDKTTPYQYVSVNAFAEGWRAPQSGAKCSICEGKKSSCSSCYRKICYQQLGALPSLLCKRETPDEAQPLYLHFQNNTGLLNSTNKTHNFL